MPGKPRAKNDYETQHSGDGGGEETIGGSFRRGGRRRWLGVMSYASRGGTTSEC